MVHPRSYAHGPTWNLSFVFIYKIWKCKSRKDWKNSIFQIEMTAKEFLIQKQMRMKSKIASKSLEQNT